MPRFSVYCLEQPTGRFLTIDDLDKVEGFVVEDAVIDDCPVCGESHIVFLDDLYPADPGGGDGPAGVREPRDHRPSGGAAEATAD